MQTFIIAEIGVNHNGRVDLAMQLVEVAAKAGAHAAKFQTFKAETVTAQNTPTVTYQKKKTGADDQHSMLKSLELSEADHRAVSARCAELGIEFMSTAFDAGSLDMLCDIGIKRIKVPSGEVNNIPYLNDCARRGLPIVLSTGMADMAEVRRAVAVVREALPAELRDVPGTPALTVLHCTSSYPADLGDVNLSAMTAMAKELGVAVGYSDHTLGIFVAPIAVAMGASVIEKHITLDRTMDGPDHSASIEPDELQALIKAIGQAEQIVGDGVKAPRPAEEEARRLVRRGLKVTRALAAGSVLGADDIAILRPATGLPPEYYDTVRGKQLARALEAGDPIESSDLT